MLDGRVKTLHPAIHGGLLADLRLEDHEGQLERSRDQPFELVVVNLYPFVETVASGAVGDDVVEQIDIGGPPWCAPRRRTTPTSRSSVSPGLVPGDHRRDRGGRHDARAAP